MKRTPWSRLAVVLGIGLAAPPALAFDDLSNTIQTTHAHQQTGSPEVQITTLSTRNDLISGGDVLVRIDVAAPIALASRAVRVKGDAVPGASHADGHALVGLVTGLGVGDTLLEAQQAATPRHTALVLTNFPITGPVLSGPHLTPYECRTVGTGEHR